MTFRLGLTYMWLKKKLPMTDGPREQVLPNPAPDPTASADRMNRSGYPRGRVPSAAAVIIGTVLVVIFALISSPGDHRGLYFVVAALVCISIPVHIFYLRGDARVQHSERLPSCR
jgi:hypothetical protein